MVKRFDLTRKTRHCSVRHVRPPVEANHAIGKGNSVPGDSTEGRDRSGFHVYCGAAGAWHRIAGYADDGRQSAIAEAQRLNESGEFEGTRVDHPHYRVRTRTHTKSVVCISPELDRGTGKVPRKRSSRPSKSLQPVAPSPKVPKVRRSGQSFNPSAVALGDDPGIAFQARRAATERRSGR